MHPYAVACAVTLGAAALLAAARPWGIDFWVHATAVDRLAHDLTDPGGLQIAPADGASGVSSYYSPYTLVLAFVARMTGIPPVLVLSLAAVPVTALLLYGLHRFTRAFTDHRWVPVLALVFALALWGPRMRVWSGYLQVFNLPVALPTPATFASGLMLLTWAHLARTLRRPSGGGFVVLTLLAATITLSHQITAVNTALGCLALSIWLRPGPKAAWGLILSAVATLVLVVVWPYYPALDLVGANDLDAWHAVLAERIWLFEGLVVLTLPALVARWRRDHRDALVWIVALSAVVVGVAASTGNYVYVRAVSAGMVAAHVALAVELMEQGWWRHATGRVWTALTVPACAVTLVLNSGNLLYILPANDTVARVQHSLGHTAVPPDHSWLARHLVRGDVVLTDDVEAQRIITAYGALTVAPGWPDPIVAVGPERERAVARFFDPATAPDRLREILTRWDVRWVLMAPGDARVSPDLALPLTAVGPRGERLYRVSPAP